MNAQVVLHIVSDVDWNASGDHLTPPSVAAEGFVHLSAPDQVAWVANQRFVGRADLLLLVVTIAGLPQPLVWEDCYETGQAFPHLYAPLPRSAVAAVLPYLPGPDGVFEYPELP